MHFIIKLNTEQLKNSQVSRHVEQLCNIFMQEDYSLFLHALNLKI
jgi:hypothetical protein